MADRRARALLAVAAVLAVLRFVVVPWIEAQNEAHDGLQVLTQRLERSVGVVQNREALSAARQGLAEANAQARERFPTAESVEAFRIEGQRRLGDLAVSAGLKLTLFDWLLDGKVEDAALAFGRVRVQVEGAPWELARLHTDLEGRLPHVAIREVQLSVPRGSSGAADGRATLTLVADVYFRLQEVAR